jgi:peptide/nickel transport system substrate-binding protein
MINSKSGREAVGGKGIAMSQIGAGAPSLRISRRQWLKLSTAAALAACAPNVPSASTSPSAIPVKGGTLLLPIFGEPLPLNSVLRRELAAITVMSVLFSQLTRIDPVTKQAAPDLAKAWEVAPDGLSWVFHLQDKAKWHDGADFTADDVTYTFEQVFDTKNASPIRTTFSSVTKVEKIDRATVKFSLREPLMAFPVLLAISSTFRMMPRHVHEGQDLSKATKFNSESPIGTGPFKVKAIVPGSHVEMTAFDDFYRGRPHLDTLIWKIVPDANVRVAQLKSGELHTAAVEAASLAAVQNDATLEIADIPTTESNFFQLNYKEAVFQDKRVRQALIYALDRQAIMNAVAGGRGHLMAGTIPPAVTFWHNGDLKPYTFDVEKAKSLLTDAGWQVGADGIRVKDGKRLSFRCTFDSTGQFKKQITVLAQQYWRAVGVDAQVQEIDRAVYAQELMNSSFVMTFTNRAGAQWDPDAQRVYYITGGGSNFGKYSNAKIDELLQAAAREVDSAKRKALYREYDAIAFDDAHVIHGYFPRESRVSSRKLHGVPELPLRDAYFYVDTWYLDK